MDTYPLVGDMVRVVSPTKTVVNMGPHPSKWLPLGDDLINVFLVFANKEPLPDILVRVFAIELQDDGMLTVSHDREALGEWNELEDQDVPASKEELAHSMDALRMHDRTTVEIMSLIGYKDEKYAASVADFTPLQHLSFLDTMLRITQGSPKENILSICAPDADRVEHWTIDIANDYQRATINMIAALESHGRNRDPLLTIYGDSGMPHTRLQKLKTILARVIAAGNALRSELEFVESQTLASGGDGTDASSSIALRFHDDQKDASLKIARKFLQWTAMNHFRHREEVMYAPCEVPRVLDKQWAPVACTGVLEDGSRCPENSMWVMYGVREREFCAPCAARSGVDGACTNRVWSTRAPHSAANPKWIVNVWTSPCRTRSFTWIPLTQQHHYGSEYISPPPLTISDVLQTVFWDSWISDAALWEQFLKNPKMLKMNMSDVMKSCDVDEFPIVKCDRALVSFANGMYNICTNMFYPYHAVPYSWSKRGARTFIPEMFDPMLVHRDLTDLVENVPGFTFICQQQRLDPDTVFYLLSMLGRCLVPMGIYEDMQKIPLLIGIGGSGKSSIAKAVMALVGNDNVFTLSCNCERVFGLANIDKKMLWACPEMGANFAMSVTDLLSMVSGDNLSFAKKNVDAITIPNFKIPGILVGNEVPKAWLLHDPTALDRRIETFMFDFRPSIQDASVSKALHNNLSVFLVTVSRAYAQMVKLQEEHAWVTPRQVVEFKQVILATTSEAMQFWNWCMDSASGEGMVYGFLPYKDTAEKGPTEILGMDPKLARLIAFAVFAELPASKDPLACCAHATRGSIERILGEMQRGDALHDHDALKASVVANSVSESNLREAYGRWLASQTAAHRGKGNFEKVLKTLSLPRVRDARGVNQIVGCYKQSLLAVGLGGAGAGAGASIGAV